MNNLYILITGLLSCCMAFMWSSNGFSNCIIKVIWTFMVLWAIKLLWGVPLAGFGV